MRILVTGSEGFIGKNLVARLLEEGHIVVLFDKKLKIYGDGRQTRDFTYIDDVIDELIDPQYITGIKNMSHGKETSVSDLAVAVSKACGKLSTHWEEKPRPVDGIHRRLLRSNVNCPTSLEEGLASTVEWY